MNFESWSGGQFASARGGQFGSAKGGHIKSAVGGQVDRRLHGDAHFKNFSILETTLGDFRLSPAYDLLNSRIHIEDKDFALEDALLPKNKAKGKIKEQFYLLGEMAEIPLTQIERIMLQMTSKEDDVKQLIAHSYLSPSIKRNYEQAYLTRLKKLQRP